MNIFISVFIGALISVMLVFNGTLSNAVGNYSSTVIIHIIGLITIIIVLFATKSKLKIEKNIPILWYSAGAVGVFTVLFSNISFIALGASLSISLGLLGQAISSIIIDNYGLLGMKKIKLNGKKFIGLSIMIVGIIVMTIFK